jgi:hypothetical protein
MSANKIKETKLIRTRDKEVKLCVFAAANYLEEVPKELRNRFFIVKVRDYTLPEFKLIARKLVRADLADYAAEKVFDAVGPSVRDLERVGELADSRETIDHDVELMRGEVDE